ncbi:MAG: hypothetical protein GC149_09940 [Gammaproteobacteria bacterium]|nr:hypothetical protein [Gammaproteobacteria bacterium]
MTLKSVIKIFIDNTGHDLDKEFASQLKKRLLNLKLDAQYIVKTFSDLEDNNSSDIDPDNEAGTRKSIEEANIVIPIISSFYIGFVTPNIEKAINNIIDSVDRYLFPILLDDADWSNHDWIVKRYKRSTRTNSGCCV